MKNVLIVAGWKANERAGWAPWLLSTLKSRGIPSHFCQMPHPPVPLTWTAVRKLKRIARDLPSPRLIICHSFGGKIALTALSQPGFSIDAMIMVAPLYRWPLSTRFRWWKNYVNFAQLKKNCQKIIIIHSIDDKLVPFQNGIELARLCQSHGIEVQLLTMEGRGHFDPANHCFDLPEVMAAYDALCTPG